MDTEMFQLLLYYMYIKLLKLWLFCFVVKIMIIYLQRAVQLYVIGVYQPLKTCHILAIICLEL